MCDKCDPPFFRNGRPITESKMNIIDLKDETTWPQIGTRVVVLRKQSLQNYLRPYNCNNADVNVQGTWHMLNAIVPMQDGDIWILPEKLADLIITQKSTSS